MDIQKKIRIRKILRRILKVLAWISGSLLVLLLALMLFIYLRKDKIKEYLIEKINTYLVAEITVDNVDVTLFDKFPYVSLVFSNVVIPEVINGTGGEDTLISAKTVYLQFNLWDVIRKQYRVRRVSVEKSSCSLKVFKDGTDNYHFWKNDTTASDEGFEVYLQRVRFDSLDFKYVDAASSFSTELNVEKFVIAGAFYEDVFDVAFTGSMQSRYMTFGKNKLFEHMPLECTGKMNANLIDHIYTFTDAEVLVSSVLLFINGTFSNGEVPEINMTARNEQCRFSDIVELLPSNYATQLDVFQKKGDIKIICSIKGKITGKSMPAVNISVNLQNGRFVREDQGITLEEINLDMEYTCDDMMYTDQAELLCRSFSAKLGTGSIEGRFKMIGFSRSDIQLELKAALDLADVQKFIQYKDIQALTGNIAIDLQFVGHFNDIDSISVRDFLSAESSGTLTSDRIELRLESFGEPLLLSNVNARFSQKDLIIDDLSVMTCGSDITISGKALNIFPFLVFDNQQLTITGDAKSNAIRIDKLLEANAIDSESSDEAGYFDLPHNISLQLNLSVKDLYYDSFWAKNVKTNLQLNKKVLLLRDLFFNSMDGSIEGEVLIDASAENNMEFRTIARLFNINITRAFIDLKNFGQNSLTDKHLSGYLSGTVHVTCSWSKALVVDYASLKAVADIEVRNGSIRGYEPLSGLRKYFKRRDFNNVEFQTLKNEIIIQDQVILIPEMTIQSSAMNFEMSGTHNFDNEIDYTFKILFSELTKIERDKPRAEDEYGTIVSQEESQLTWHFRVTGTVDNPKFVPLDIRAAGSKVNENMKKEGEKAKNLLQEEFGQKKDSTNVIITHEDGETPKIQIQWDDE